MRKYSSVIFAKTRNAPTDNDLMSKVNSFYADMIARFKDGWKIEFMNYTSDGSTIFITVSYESTSS